VAIASVNPATGETLATFEPMSAAEVDERLDRAVVAARALRRAPFGRRADWMRSAANLLDAECEEVARVMVLEMGKPIGAARAEVAKCATACRFYADHAEAFLADEPADASAVGAARAFVRYQPLGPVLAVMPWNFPLWQAIRFAAPALMAGNVGVLKHASNVPQTAQWLGELFARAGFPDGAFQSLLIGADRVEAVLRDPRIRAATLTGSTAAGQAIARVAGEVVKLTVLELGGSDAFVVLPSADIGRAATVAVTARCQNNGQSCIAAKRFIVHEAVADEFEAAMVARMEALRMGDPLEDGTELGPLALEQGRADAEALVADAVEHGARVRCGGTRPAGPGWFYPATVITGITPEMRMYHEEVFAPVAQLHRARDLDDALRLANDTPYGLGSNVWTDDPAEQARCIDKLDAGGVFVNGMTTSYPPLPFGGVKESGYGRELSVQGIRAFCNTKTVWVGGPSGHTDRPAGAGVE
jgi:succinate-semialdehyde dehydrogenase/glutarate-semialdehyde dehydrogenase